MTRYAIDIAPMARTPDGRYRAFLTGTFRRYTTANTEGEALGHVRWRMFGSPSFECAENVYTDGEGTHYRMTAHEVAV